MDEYIPREAITHVIKELRKAHKLYEGEEMMFSETDIYGLLSSIPVADVAPVKHGSLGLEYVDEYYGLFADCKECGEWNVVPCKYCRNCGADMRESKEE